jgi:Xaa-Pro aminopeptidase
MVLPLEGNPHLVTPVLEAGPYRRCPLEICIHTWSDVDGATRAIQETVTELGLSGKWGLEGEMPYRFIDWVLRFAQPEFQNVDSLLEHIRAIKDTGEVKLLTRSAAILSKTFAAIPKMIKAGMTEVELAQQITHETQCNGAETVPDMLIQSGPMAADAHHLPTSRRIKRKESIVVDATCTYGGYFADITRTFMLGRNPPFEKLYVNLLEAQVAAVEAARPGVQVGAIDNVARASLREKNLDAFFVHRTGHGLGLGVHEEPYIIPGGSETLQPSMAFTVEPGIYKQGRTGLRIEDNLLTKAKSSVVLTKSAPKEYGWWN